MPKSRVRFIFTYGTLMSNCSGRQGAHERGLLQRNARLIGMSRIRGRLYEAGACPGTTLGGTRTDNVEGEIWELPAEHEDMLAVLDRYEGCAEDSPRPFTYRRRRIRVRTQEGRRVTAWIYLWSGSTNGLQRVMSGRWREAHESHAPQSHAEAACPNEHRDPVRSGRLTPA